MVRSVFDSGALGGKLYRANQKFKDLIKNKKNIKKYYLNNKMKNLSVVEK